MPYAISLNKDGFIEIVLTGYIPITELVKALEKIYLRVDELERRGKDALVLVDFTGIGKVDPRVVKLVQHMVRTAPEITVAAYGGTSLVTSLARVVATVARSHLRLFKAREEARAWLLSVKEARAKDKN